MAPKYQKLSGKHVLVIGGSSGLGLGIAEACLEAGARVTISSSSQDRITNVLHSLKTKALASSVDGFPCDLKQPDLEANLEALFTKAGSVNHVVLTAGDTLPFCPLETLTPELIHKTTQMRFVVPFIVAKVAIRHLEKSSESSLILTSGSAAWKAPPGFSLASYFSGGIHSMVRALANELRPVRVNCVQPGFVDTGLWSFMSEEEKAKLFREHEETMPAGRVGRVEDVVEAYLWLLKDRNATGAVANTDSGQLVV